MFSSSKPNFVNVSHSLAEQVLQGGVFLARALWGFTAHYHICLWNNTEGEDQNTFVNWHVDVSFTIKQFK